MKDDNEARAVDVLLEIAEDDDASTRGERIQAASALLHHCEHQAMLDGLEAEEEVND